jgi:hypothetical protein
LVASTKALKKNNIIVIETNIKKKQMACTFKGPLVQEYFCPSMIYPSLLNFDLETRRVNQRDNKV